MYLKCLLTCGILCFQGIYASNENIDSYLKYIKAPNFGRIGDYTKGEMQIVDNYDEILSVQNKYYNEFILKGFSVEEAKKHSQVGVVTEDRYWIWFRDPVVLPNGKTTAYNRFFPKSALNGAAGVSVMGISEKGQVLVNIIFRHATREWEMELPRGGRGKNETSEEAALRELVEETGVRAMSIQKISSIASDSGILPNVLDIFVATNLVVSKETDREDCEAIHDCFFISKNSLKQAYIDGYIEMEMHGKKVKVFCRDAFLASALLVAEAKGLL